MRRAAGSTSRPFAIARSAGRTSRKARFGVSKWSLKSVSNGHSEPSVDSSVCMAGARAPAIAGAAETSTRAAPRLSATTKRVKHEGSLNPRGSVMRAPCPWRPRREGTIPGYFSHGIFAAIVLDGPEAVGRAALGAVKRRASSTRPPWSFG